jgi:putative spermidine/putrescine transport system permease protein
MAERTGRLGDALYAVFVFGLGSAALIFMVTPVAIGLLMSFTDGQTLKFPPDGLSLRWYRALFDRALSEPIHVAAWHSFTIAGMAALGALLLAVPAAYGMTRIAPRLAGAFEPLLVAPLILPSLIYGLAALITAGRLGIPASLPLVVVGHVVVFAPLMYRSCLALAQRLDPRLEEASAMLGASRPRTFLRVTLPLLVPGILAGAFLVFIHSLDNVSVTLFLADARTTVLPLRMFQMIEESLDVRVAALSGLLILSTLVVLLLVQRLAPLLRSGR